MEREKPKEKEKWVQPVGADPNQPPQGEMPACQDSPSAKVFHPQRASSNSVPPKDWDTQGMQQEAVSLLNTQQIFNTVEELMFECKLENEDDIDKQIENVSELIDELASAEEDTTELVAHLEKLRKLKTMVTKKSPTVDLKSLRGQLQVKLDELKIKEDQLDSELKRCRQKVNLMNRLNKITQLLEDSKLRLSKLEEAKRLLDRIKNSEGSSNPKNPSLENTRASKPNNEPLEPEELILTDQNNRSSRHSYEPSITSQALLKSLNVDEVQRWEVMFRLSEHEAFQPLKGQLSEVLSYYSPRVYCRVVRKYRAESTKKSDWFPEGTPISKIKEILGSADSCCFSTKRKCLEEKKQINEDLLLLPSQECIIALPYPGEPIKRYTPLSIPTKDLPSYLELQQLQESPRLFVSKIRIQNQWVTVNSQKALSTVLKGRVLDEVRLAYRIQLSIEVTTSRTIWHIDSYPINSDDTLQSVKEKFEQNCKVESHLQTWSTNNQALSVGDKTFEEMGFTCERYNIEVNETYNLENYGFSKVVNIKVESFREFYVEDDELFKKSIERSRFPTKQFEPSFRVMVLGFIFAAVKKHCRIQSAIKYVNQLIANSSKYIESVKLWKSPFFTEKYLLYHILQSADDDLKIDFMRAYKPLAPLPLMSRLENTVVQNYSSHHFWFSRKSFVVLSLEVGEPIFGKSTLMNRLFTTSFELRDKNHPICRNSVEIQYDIYRNSSLLVDVIDVATSSLSEVEKQELCQVANMLVVHFKGPIEPIQTWLGNKLLSTPVIFIERDTNIMQNQIVFNNTISQNIGKTSLKLSVPELDESNLRDHSINLDKIAEQIHAFVSEQTRKSTNQKTSWNFMKYLSKGKPNLEDVVRLFEKIEEESPRLITEVIQANAQARTVQQLPDIIIRIVEVAALSNNKNRVLKMLSQYLKFLRDQRLSEFNTILKIREIDGNCQKVSSLLKQSFGRITQLRLTSPELENEIANFKGIPSPSSKDITQILERVRETLIYVLKPREFSIENFWRRLAAEFKRKRPEQYLPNIQSLYSRAFTSNSVFEVINGETLQMPIELLRSNLSNFPQHKKIMVVGIFGPQSSGKSTLLNFLFGCDFLSSDGRCTTGIYGTYYDINNLNINGCEGILLLDTEGLFSNYTNQHCKNRSNFDNKLVLFLLKTCDLLIMNTKGDMDGKCTNILELAFDCALLEEKEGSRYPNFSIVLNQPGGEMNEQQRIQIQDLTKTICKVAPYMERYLTTNQSQSIPSAFNISDQSIDSSTLKEVQRQVQTPTQKFYESTKELCGKLIKTLKVRARENGQRTLSDIYDEMSRIWATVLKVTDLTKHFTRELKLFEESLEAWKHDRTRSIQDMVSQFRIRIPQNLRELDQWQRDKEIEFRNYISSTMQSYQAIFLKNGNSIRDSMIESTAQEIEPRLRNNFNSFKVEITSLRYKLEIAQSTHRGLQEIDKEARELRNKLIQENKTMSEPEKVDKFEAVWKIFTGRIESKFNTAAASKQIELDLRDYYEQTVKRSNRKIRMIKQADSLFRTQEEQDPSLNIPRQPFEDYSHKSMQKLLEFTKKPEYNYQSLNIPPIICTPQVGATRVNYKYLDMRKYFSISESQNTYYFNPPSSLDDCFNHEAVREYIEKEFKSKDLDRFVDGLESDLKLFNVSANNVQQVVKALLLNEVCFYQKESVFNWKDLSYIKPTQTRQRVNKFLANRISYCLNILTKEDLREQLSEDCRRLEAQELPRNGFYKLVKTAIQNYCRKENSPIFSGDFERSYKKLQEEVKADFAAIGLRLSDLKLGRPKISWSIGIKSPIKISNRTELTKRINSLHPAINKKMIDQSTSINSTKLYIPIAVASTACITVRQGSQYEEMLKSYMNKQYDALSELFSSPNFKEFMKTAVNLKLLIANIVEKVEDLPIAHANFEEAIQRCLPLIKNEIQCFNTDLCQISHELSYLLQAQLHDFCLHLLWKKCDLSFRDSRQKDMKDIQEQKARQKQFFMGMLDARDSILDDINAAKLVAKYIDFLTTKNNEAIRNFLESSRQEFKKKYSRAEVQRLIDWEMSNCRKKEIALKYLTDPKSFAKERYDSFVKQEISKQDQFSSSCATSFKQLVRRVGEINEEVGIDDQSWSSQLLFCEGEQNPRKSLAKIFFELLRTGETIHSDNKGNPWKLTPGAEFKLKSKLIQRENVAFLEAELLDLEEISNYSRFITALHGHLKKASEEFHKSMKISATDREAFIAQVELLHCPNMCPFCKRLCDIDMRDDFNHAVHRCNSGHQMRAIAGIRVEQRKESGYKRYYGSVARCEEIDLTTVVEFDNKLQTWEEVCGEYNNQQSPIRWDFSKSEKYRVASFQKKMFVDLWDLVGQEICEQRSRQDKLEMRFLNYSEATVHFSNTIEESDTQYVIAIDGSGSMCKDKKWDQQLVSLKEILNELDENPKNHVSIIVFTDDPVIVYENEKPSEIMVDTINHPRGATVKEAIAAFTGGNAVMKRYAESMNIYFVYISDGHGDHPTEEIEETLRIRNTVLDRGNTFHYASILIGGDLAESGMGKIQEKLPGESRWVKYACQIGSTFKEIIAKV